jgi:hypothetical protein
MIKADWLGHTTPAFRLIIATSWLAPESWQQNQEVAILEALDAGPDWKEYLSLVDRHRTPALSWAALSRVRGIAIPAFAKQELQKRSDACRMKAMQHCLLLAEVLKRFNHAGIPVMPLKGQILSLELYGDLGLRETLDVDLEVARKDLGRAQACLESADWHPDATFSPMTPRQWDSFLKNEHSMTFLHARTGRMLELHWRNQWETPDATSARWARGIPSAWQGCAIQAMSPGDLALYLCGHGGGHLWFRAKWVGDLARAHAIGLLDWEAAWDEAQRSGQQSVLQVGLSLLHLLYGLPLPDLPGDPAADLPQFLIEIPLRALHDSAVPGFSTDVANFRYRIQLIRYQHALRPRTTWRDSLSELFHSREDFRMLPLPDGFFWAYKPLRPVLWLWRWVWKTKRHRS